MATMFSPQALYVIFTGAASVELFFFMMQRSALEISRTADIHPRDGRYMLPLWYALLWPARLLKWLSAFFIATTINWVVAVGLLIVAFIACVVVPIPHRYFIGTFRRKVRKELVLGENVQLYMLLEAILERTESDASDESAA